MITESLSIQKEGLFNIKTLQKNTKKKKIFGKHLQKITMCNII